MKKNPVLLYPRKRSNKTYMNVCQLQAILISFMNKCFSPISASLCVIHFDIWLCFSHICWSYVGVYVTAIFAASLIYPHENTA